MNCNMDNSGQWTWTKPWKNIKRESELVMSKIMSPWYLKHQQQQAHRSVLVQCHARNGQKTWASTIKTRYVRRYHHIENMRPGGCTNYRFIELGQKTWQQQNEQCAINTHNSIVILAHQTLLTMFDWTPIVYLASDWGYLHHLATWQATHQHSWLSQQPLTCLPAVKDCH